MISKVLIIKILSKEISSFETPLLLKKKNPPFCLSPSFSALFNQKSNPGFLHGPIGIMEIPKPNESKTDVYYIEN